MQINTTYSYKNSFNVQPAFKAIRFSENYDKKIFNMVQAGLKPNANKDNCGNKVNALRLWEFHKKVKEAYKNIEFDMLKLVRTVVEDDKKGKKVLNPEVCEAVINELEANPTKRDLVIDDIITSTEYNFGGSYTTTDHGWQVTHMSPGGHYEAIWTSIKNDVLPFIYEIREKTYDHAEKLPLKNITRKVIGSRESSLRKPLTDAIYDVPSNPKKTLEYFNNACIPFIKSALIKLDKEQELQNTEKNLLQLWNKSVPDDKKINS